MKAHPRRLVALLVTGVAALSLAACTTSTGSDVNSGSTGSSDFELPSDAQQLLDEAMQAPSWTPPKSAPKPAEGKFVVSIPCSQAAVGCSRPGDAFLDAAKTLGWRTQLIDPAGDPKKMQAALQQALQLDVDGVYMAGGSVEAIGEDLLKEMRDRGVAMFVHGGDNQPLGAHGWNGVMNNDYSVTAPVLAAYVAKDSAGTAKVLLVNNSEFPEVDNGAKTFEEKLPEYCDSCEITDTLDYSIVDLMTTLPARVKAALQANPDINYIYAPYDFAGTQMAIAIEQAGLVGKVKIVGADGNPQNLQSIKDGTQAASYARPWELMGWAVADEMNRVFNSDPTIDDARGFQTEDYPMQLLDKSNLPDDVEEPWNAGIDYRAAYKELWGIR